MRILFEGSAEQIENLLRVVELNKSDMPTILSGYATGSLWHASDVQTFYKCSEDDAIKILDSAVNSEPVVDKTYHVIEDICDSMGLLRIGYT